MGPLDLRAAPPRGPRVKLAGLYFTARVVDKLRASFEGGHLNGYFDSLGFSLTWQHFSKIELAELRKIVAECPTEEAVATWIDERLTQNGIDRDRVNAKLESFTTDRMPGGTRPLFEATYPADLRAANPHFFDLFEADDERHYAAT